MREYRRHYGCRHGRGRSYGRKNRRGRADRQPALRIPHRNRQLQQRDRGKSRKSRNQNADRLRNRGLSLSQQRCRTPEPDRTLLCGRRTPLRRCRLCRCRTVRGIRQQRLARISSAGNRLLLELHRPGGKHRRRVQYEALRPLRRVCAKIPGGICGRHGTCPAGCGIPADTGYRPLPPARARHRNPGAGAHRPLCRGTGDRIFRQGRQPHRRPRLGDKVRHSRHPRRPTDRCALAGGTAILRLLPDRRRGCGLPYPGFRSDGHPPACKRLSDCSGNGTGAGGAGGHYPVCPARLSRSCHAERSL